MKALVMLGMSVILISCVGNSDNSITSAEAQKICLGKKRSAEGPTGEISLSTGSEGSSAGVKLNFHSDYLVGKDPNSVYLDCMLQLSSRIKKV